MKKFTFKGVLDGIRSSVAPQIKPDQEIVETLRPDYFQVAKTFRHGFPYQPTALAFDPIQRLLAIGTKNGSLRIIGRPGVDAQVRHELEAAVVQVEFLMNEGALITVTADDSVHLWNFRQKRADVVHSLKFQRERITVIHLPLRSKWLYVGSERGNVHFVNVETFTLSGYIINWNKAIEVTRPTHPGPIVHLSDNPADSSKLLIGFETGLMVLWDLKTKKPECRWQWGDSLKSVDWHFEGKQFTCSHNDGSLTTWNVKPSSKPANIIYPHAKNKTESCKPIQKVEWKSSKSGESYLIFSGGLTADTAGRVPSITIMHGKTTTVLEMDHNIVDFVTLCESPYNSDVQEPYAVAVLMQNDLVLIDLLSSGYPCFENPHPMDIHESPVSCVHYIADCPSDLIPAFYSVGSRSASKRTGYSENKWPIAGGEWSPTSCSYNEIILTGHTDGSVRFWDASAGSLQVLYKLKTAKVFEKARSKSPEGGDEDQFSVQLLSFCPESRKLAVAGISSYVVLFKFRKLESTFETTTLEIPIYSESLDEAAESSPEEAPSKPPGASDDSTALVKVRTGPQKKPPGFQACLACVTPSANGEPPGQITALTINSSYGLLAYGLDNGIVIVDFIQKCVLLNISTADMYGSADPYQRAPRSPKRTTAMSETSDGERCRSPSIDQIIATITDNGSNFVKAFKVFGVKLTHFDNIEDSAYNNLDLFGDASVDSQGEDDEQLTVETTEELENSPWLPRHLRCCAHTLSLFATSDLIKTIQSPLNSQLNEIHTSAMKKCTLLWNASNRPKSAEVILQILGHHLSRPGDTRWNSLYDSLKQIFKNKEKNCELFEALGLKNSMLKDSEYIYIEEHLNCVGPLAEALDILQGENNMFYGFILPVILSLRRKVKHLLLKDWRYCEPLVNSILASIEKRFSNIVNLNTIEAENAAIAAFSHPKFKNRWLSCIDSSQHDRLLKMFKTAIANKIEEINIMSSTNSELREQECNEESNDFFNFEPLVSTESYAQQSRRSATSEAEIQVVQFFNNSSEDLTILHQYPAIKEIFLRFNTPLPSSAPVERLFSYATMTNLPKSNKLSDDMFEERVILKSNLKI